MIDIKNISVKLSNNEIIKDFDLTLPDRGVICLFGPSGCGKTTLLNTLAGLCPLAAGQISGLEDKRVGYLFQDDRLLPWLTALANVEVLLDKENKAKAKEYLELLSLKDALDKYPAELSGGMQRRVSLGAMLAYGGELFLMDEPTRGLDSALSGLVLKHIIELAQNKLILLVTHSAKEAALLSDVVYIVRGTPLTIEGRINFDTPQSQRLESPQLQAEYAVRISSYQSNEL